MSKLPDYERTLTGHLRENQRQMQRQANSSSFNRSGTSVTAEGVTEVDGELDVTGALVVTGSETVNGPLAVHGTAAFDGNTTIGGNAAITGTLSLPAGIIGNDALANPVEVGQASASEYNYATTLTDAHYADAYITVPTGFSQALVMVVVNAGAINSSASVDYLRLSAGIGADASREEFGMAGAGSSISTATAKSTLLTGLSGGTINVYCLIHTQGNAWAANASNRAFTEAIAVFLR